jgi:hypothetical protein
MPGVATGPRELDRKLYRVVHEADPERFPTSTALAGHLHERESIEFSYRREGQTVMSTVATIERYVSYAQAISLLDGGLSPMIDDPAQITGVDDFQGWLATHALDYLNERHCTAVKIKSVAKDLLGENPPRLPTVANIHEKLVSLIDRRDFEYSARIVARLAPANFRLRAAPTFVIRGVVSA